MDAERTDELIAHAIAALPYSRPSAGFAAGVMGRIAPAGTTQFWRERVLKAADIIIAGWAAIVVFGSVRFVHMNLGDIAASLIQPGGFMRGLNLLGAHAALALTKLAAAVRLISDLVLAVGPGFPAWYEIAAAVLVSFAVVYAVSGGRAAAQRI